MNSKLSRFFWEGFRASQVDVRGQQVHIHLDPEENHRPLCSNCLQSCRHVYDSSLRCVREADFLGLKTFLYLPVRRVCCDSCGIKVEAIPWLSRYSRITIRLQNQTEALARVLPIKHVTELVGLHWDTVKNIDKLRLSREVKEPDWSRVKRLVMDEFAIHKGHRYATVIVNADNHQVLWVCLGNRRVDIRPFFEHLGKHCIDIEAVAMDMNTAFDLEVKQHCPQAEVVYDLFHVVAKYGREVVDRVRVDRANELKHDKPARKLVKGSRWLLLKNRKNLNTQQSVSLEELLQANQPLSTVYILAEQLKLIWRAPSVWEAFLRWRSWLRQAEQSGLDPLKLFVKRLKPYLRGILAAAKYRLHTSCIEGINNKIKVIKRMAYGFRDNEYFFLKIKAAFHGNP
jgi:transposase